MAKVTKIEKNLFLVEGKLMFFRGEEVVSRAFKTSAKAESYAAGLRKNNADVAAERASHRSYRLSTVNAYLAARAVRATDQIAFDF
jgi:hypothetical protein